MYALSIRNLVKVYANGIKALQGIDLDVAEGDFFALLGPNGAGKTTVIGIITALVTKSVGKVEVFGHNIDDDLNAAKACLGVVPQEINLNVFDEVENIVVNQAGFYGIGKRLSGKSKIVFTKNIVNKNPSDKYVKILLTDNLVNEIHLFNKGKTNTLKAVGFGVVGLYVLAVLATLGAILIIAGGL